MINNSMLTFRQYLAEIFRPSAVYRAKEKHPDVTHDSDERVSYANITKDSKGKPISAKTIRTDFMNMGQNNWEVLFSVGGYHGIEDPSKEFPSDVARKVFDHISHFVQTQHELSGKKPFLQYDTEHPKKHRIYQAGAKRLKIVASNVSALPPNKELDRPRR